MEFVLLYLVYGVIVGSFCAYLAGQKGRGGGSWFFLGLVFGILALLVLIGLPGEKRSPTAASNAEVERRRNARLCPHCIQEVHELASACPHCQRYLPEVEHCSYEPCLKIINPTDVRCVDSEGNPYCGDLHRRYNEPPAPTAVEGTDESYGWMPSLVVLGVVALIAVLALLDSWLGAF